MLSIYLNYSNEVSLNQEKIVWKTTFKVGILVFLNYVNIYAKAIFKLP